jgi:YesN/AraC family two-component response regulator
LLKNTSKSVKEIAAKVGYNNEATFYKLFKKQYGITPAEYRHNLVLKQNNKL